MEEKIEIRKDLNEIVKKIGFGTVKSNYSTRHPLRVILEDGTSQGKILEFRDSDGVYDAVQSYQSLGVTDFIKSKELVEETSVDEDGTVTGKYICVKYELVDGNIFRFFPSRTQNIIIENLYKLYKKNHKAPVKQG